MLNEIYVKIEGLNLYRIVQKLIDKGVLLSNLKIKKTYILFLIDIKYKEKLDKICQQERKKYYVVKNTKIKRFFAKLPYCLGGFIPFLILFAFFYGINNTIFCVNLNFESEKNFDLSQVQKVLLDNNITSGAKKSKFSAKEIEKIILTNTENISGCEVFYEGQNLNIIVFPAIKKNENAQKNLLSKYNAIITSIDVFAGDSKVVVGQLVQAGDVLIEYNEGAQGDIKGKVYFSASRIYCEKQEKFVKTGKVFETSAFNFANLITYSAGDICAFENYQLEKQTEVLIKNLFVPVVKEKYIYHEVKLEEEIVPYSQVEDEIKNSLKKEVFAKIPEDLWPKDVTYSVVKEGDYVRVDCFAEIIISLL